jgi:hypothetical protein
MAIPNKKISRRLSPARLPPGEARTRSDDWVSL